MEGVLRDNVPAVTGVLSLVSLSVVVLAVGGYVPDGAVPTVPALVAAAPHANAALSLVAIAAVLVGLRAIRRGDVPTHRRAMLVAFASFLSFLSLYLYKVAAVGRTTFGEPAAVRTFVYLPVLAVHVTLAIVTIPLVYYVLLLAATRSIHELPETPHPRVGRVAARLWLVTFALGEVVYVLLYWLF